MKFIVAVSGGVDSVALLHMLVRQYGQSSRQYLIVAHMNHGIRPDASSDAEFVRSLARSYGLDYEQADANLGPGASEERARHARYTFLNELARQYKAQVITAHHLDDLVETVALNVTRGTGWRGLAVFGAPVKRPLLDMTKQDVIEYAQHHGLEWREDSTNTSDAYLRNRLRRRTTSLTLDDKRQLHALYAHQRALAKEIHKETTTLVGDGPTYSRYFFTHVNPVVALECLRFITKGALTRPQLQRLLHAVKVALPATTYEAGAGVKIHFSTRHFSL